MSDLVLYNYFRSSTSYRVRIALHLKELSYEYRSVHLLNNGGEQHSAEYRKLNAQREVPTLVRGEFKVAQSMAIIEYLDEVYPQFRLFPSEPEKAALVRQFCENINSSIHSYQNLKTLAYLEKNLGMTAEQKQNWINHFVGLGLTSLESLLVEHSGTYCFGGEITAADAFLVPQVFSATRMNVDLSPYPNIQRINATCEKHPAFAKAHPSCQPDRP